MDRQDVARGRSVEASGKTVEQAVESALARLGVSREEATIQILREASRGVLGFGAHDAIVRVTERAPAATPAGTHESVPVVAPPLAVPPMADVAEILEEETPPEAPVVVDETVAPDLDDFVPTGVGVEPASDMVEEPVLEDEEFDYEEEEEVRGPRATVSDDELLEISRTTLLDVLERMGIIGDVLATWREPEDEKDERTLILDIIGDDLGLLIGRRGETLKDLQYILRLMVGHRVHGWANIIVDVEGYKQRRERNIRQLARRMAERVVDTRKPAHMEPMNAYERRLVHLELRDMTGVTTKSSGEGERRKVGIFPAGSPEL